MNPFFVEQMAMYSAYHRDARNRATHFIGIPAIVFSLFIPLSWVPLLSLWGGEAVITLATLLWVVNLGCIDLNPWYARRDAAEQPDWLMLDLDPGPEAPFAGDAAPFNATWTLVAPPPRVTVWICGAPPPGAETSTVKRCGNRSWSG